MRGPLGWRLFVVAYIALLARVLLGLLARQRQQVEGALDARDHAGGDAGVARRRVEPMGSWPLRALMALTFSPLLAASARLRCSAAGSFASASNSVPLSRQVPARSASSRRPCANLAMS